MKSPAGLPGAKGLCASSSAGPWREPGPSQLPTTPVAAHPRVPLVARLGAALKRPFADIFQHHIRSASTPQAVAPTISAPARDNATEDHSHSPAATVVEKESAVDHALAPSNTEPSPPHQPEHDYAAAQMFAWCPALPAPPTSPVPPVTASDAPPAAEARLTGSISNAAPAGGPNPYPLNFSSLGIATTIPALPELNLAQLSKTHDPPPSFTGKALPPSGHEGAGIPSAKMDFAMNAALKGNKSSGLAEQNLPETALPPLPVLSAEPVRPEAALAPAPPDNGVFILPSTIEQPFVPSEEFIEPARPAIPPAVEETETWVQQSAIQLKKHGADSLVVVLRPENGTALRLALDVQEDGIAAVLTLEAGEPGLFAAHWEQLQARLSAHGIHLAPLQSAPVPLPANTDTASDQEGPQHFTENDTEEPVLHFRERRPTESTPDRPGSTRRNAGWESWA